MLGNFPPRHVLATGIRGSFHSLAVADFNGNGHWDIFTAELEATNLLPQEANPRWFIWENSGGENPRFVERVIFDGRLGGHDAVIGDVDGSGNIDICSKFWRRWPQNANNGREHAGCLCNLFPVYESQERSKF